MHAGEDRGIGGTEPAAKVDLTGIRGRALHRLDVAGLMDPKQVLELGKGNRAEHLDIQVVEQAELACQAHRELDSDRRQRVPGAEVIRAQSFVPDNANALAHSPIPSTVLGCDHVPIR